MDQIRLERVDRSDARDCADFAQFVGAHYQGAVPVTADSVARGSGNFFWAVLEGRRVGATGYVARTPALAETVKTVIDPSWRGRGLGAAVSQAIEDAVKSAGYKKVITTIYIDNYGMILIKLRQGYRFEGFHPDHERPGWHEYSFGKVLI